MARAPIVEESHNYKIDTPIKVAVFYNNYFYCLKSNGHLFKIDGTSHIAYSSTNDVSKNIKLSNLFVYRDTLIGLGEAGTYHLDIKKNRWQFIKKGHFTPPIFEDEKYVVISTCSGEFGGSLRFANKKTKKVYECASTCTVNIIKRNNGYYNVTATLPHMSGFANIFDIANPENLKQYDRGEYQKKLSKVKFNDGKIHYIGVEGDDESQSRKGEKTLIDSIGILVLTSFEFNSKIYYLVQNRTNSVSLNTIQNKKFSLVKDLSKLLVYCDVDPVNRNCYGKLIYTYSNDHTSGFWVITGSIIINYSFDKIIN
jgi:hypothetical protein